MVGIVTSCGASRLSSETHVHSPVRRVHLQPVCEFIMGVLWFPSCHTGLVFCLAALPHAPRFATPENEQGYCADVLTEQLYMCVLGLCVYVRAGRPGRPGTRPTGEDPSGMSAGMSQVSMSPKSSVLPTSPLLLRSLLFLSHCIGIVRRFILQTERMSYISHIQNILM
jgi:hypothetical protein